MTPAQCKAARAVLQWTVFEASKRSGIVLHTLRRFEEGQHLNPEPLARLRACFEAAGLELRRDGFGVCWVAVGEAIDAQHERMDGRPTFVTLMGGME